MLIVIIFDTYFDNIDNISTIHNKGFGNKHMTFKSNILFDGMVQVTFEWIKITVIQMVGNQK